MSDIEIRSGFERRDYAAGSLLFKAGSEGEEAFLIESGHVEIAMRGRNDRQVVVSVLGRGDLLGEMALISGERRIASAVARTNVTVIVVAREEFDRRLGGMDPVMGRVLKTLTHKLRVLSERHVDEMVKIR